MAKTPIVLGYYADWAENLPPESIDYRLFTHIAHSFATFNADGAIKMPDPKRTRELIARAKRANVKTILAIGGAESNKSLSAATATPRGPESVADTILQAATIPGYDGVDIDWEAPENPEDKKRYEGLVRAVRERMPKAIITSAVPASDWAGKWFETANLAPYLDYVNVMTYDFHGPWGDHAGHNASLTPTPLDKADGDFCIASAMDYWLKTKKWPANKLLLGLPLYGRGFAAATIGGAAKGSYARSYVSYPDALKLSRDPDWNAKRDADAQVPYLEKKDGTEFVSYEDPDSARRKTAYARKRGLAGYFFWEIAQDFDGKTNPLVRAAREGWG